ncbi:uncharacterized protein METZ01_LOCUS496271, partial [marine metagenome]
MKHIVRKLITGTATVALAFSIGIA